MVSKKLGYGEWVIRYRWIIIIATLFVFVAVGSGARFIHFSNNYRVFFGKDNPQLKSFDLLENTYTKNDNVLIVLAPRDGHVFTPKTLLAVKELTHQAWQVPYSQRVESVTNFQHSWADNDDLVVEDLVRNPESLSDADLKRIKNIALSEPALRARLISPSAHVTGINVTVNMPRKSISEVPEVTDFARSMVNAFRDKHPDIDVYLTGIVMINSTFSEAGIGDMKTLVPVMYLLMMLLIGTLLRSVAGTAVTILVIAFSSITAMGLAGWLGILLTPVSANAPTVVMTLAVADSIHILVTLFYEMRQGKSKHEAIIESLRVNLQPVFLTSITTAIGFLSLNFSDTPPYRDLGNIVAMGVIAAFVYSVLFLPAIMAILPVRVADRSQRIQNFMDRFGDFVVARHQKLFWGMLIFMAVIASPILRLEINDVFVEYFDDRYTFRTDNDFVTKNLTGFQGIEYSLSAGEEGGIGNPEYLAKLAEFADWYSKQPNVVHVATFSDIMKRLNRNMHGDDDSFYKIPEERNLAAQYLLLFEMSLPYGLDLNNQINVDKSSTRLIATFDNPPTKELLAAQDRAQEWLKKNAPEEMYSVGASPTIMFSHIAKRNIIAMSTGTLMALILISGILMVALRSFKYGWVSLAPNLLPAFMAFGLWGLLITKIGFAVSVVIAISLGIIVDDTVHFLSKYLRARRELGKNAADAVRYSFHTVGSALWITSFILVIGFLVLSFSGFAINSQMGLLTIFSIGFALITDFLFLPALLIKMEKKS